MNIPTIIRFAWNYFWDAQRYLFKEGKWKAEPIHLSLIDAVLNHLQEHQKSVVREQLENRYFLSWEPDGRINVFFFYDESSLPLLSVPEFEDRLIKVELFVEGRKHVAHVIFYKGRIHSIELKKPRSFFKGKSFRVGSVTEGKPSDSYTGAIDRLEHGKETETNP